MTLWDRGATVSKNTLLPHVLYQISSLQFKPIWRSSGSENFGDAGARLLGTVAWLTPRNTRLCAMCATVPNLVTVDQTVLAYVGSTKILGDAEASPP